MSGISYRGVIATKMRSPVNSMSLSGREFTAKTRFLCL
jgi:hypothetical protein